MTLIEKTFLSILSLSALLVFACGSGKLTVKSSEDLIKNKLSKLPHGRWHDLNALGTDHHCSNADGAEGWLTRNGYLECTERPDELNPGRQILVFSVAPAGKTIFPAKANSMKPNEPSIRIGTYKVIVDEGGAQVANPATVPFHVELMLEPVWAEAVKNTWPSGTLENQLADFRKGSSGVARFVRNANGDWELLEIQPTGSRLKEIM
jgi:hypothetical protein